MGYKVKLNVFEGPFDLLVYLIENAQMSIYDIKISEITDQYLEYVKEMERQDVSAAAEFMVLAASLLEIKSKMLLPRLAVGEEGAASEDPRSELVEKLLEYKRFKLLAEMLREKEETGQRIMEKPQEDLSIYTHEADEQLNLDLNQFVSAFHLFLQKKKRLEEIRKHHVRSEKQRITTEARMLDIREFFRMDPSREANFKELVAKKGDHYDIALTFSSLLEMMKENRLEAEQKYLFGDITVRATEYLMEGKPNDQQKNNESRI